MVTKPNVYPEFSTSIDDDGIGTITDPVSGQQNAQPPIAIGYSVAEGVKLQQFIPRQLFNHLAGLTNNWIKWLHQETLALVTSLENQRYYSASYYGNCFLIDGAGSMVSSDKAPFSITQDRRVIDGSNVTSPAIFSLNGDLTQEVSSSDPLRELYLVIEESNGDNWDETNLVFEGAQGNILGSFVKQPTQPPTVVLPTEGGYRLSTASNITLSINSIDGSNVFVSYEDGASNFFPEQKFVIGVRTLKI